MIRVKQHYSGYCEKCEEANCKQYRAKVFFKGFANPLTQLVIECQTCNRKIGLTEKSIVYTPIIDDTKIEKI